MWESNGGAPLSKKKADLWRHGVVKISAQEEARSFYNGIVQDVEVRSRAVLVAGKNRHHRPAPAGVPVEGGRTLAEASAVAGELRQRWSALLESHGVELDAPLPQGADSNRSSSSSNSPSSITSSSSSSSSSSTSKGPCRPKMLGAGLSDEFGQPAKRVAVESSLHMQSKAPRSSVLFQPSRIQPSPSVLNFTNGQPGSSSSDGSSSRNCSSSSSSNNRLQVTESIRNIVSHTTAVAEGPLEEGSEGEDGNAGTRGREFESLLALNQTHEAHGGAISQDTEASGTSNAKEAPDAAGFVLAANVAVAMGEIAPGRGGSGSGSSATSTGYGDDEALLMLLEQECYEGENAPKTSPSSSSQPPMKKIEFALDADAVATSRLAAAEQLSMSSIAASNGTDLAGPGSLNWQQMAGLRCGSSGKGSGKGFGHILEGGAGSDSDSLSEPDSDDPELAYLLPPKSPTPHASTAAAVASESTVSSLPSSSSSLTSVTAGTAPGAASTPNTAAAATATAITEATNRGQDKDVCDNTILADRVRVARSTDAWRLRLRSGCARLGGQEHRVLEWKLKLNVDF